MNGEQQLPDTNQSWWQLSVIQLAGWMSLPTLATSILILQVNSFLGAILTIIVGNAILWFIRLGIVSMSHEKRQSTLDISKDYLGNFGSYFIAVLLLVSTLAWYITQMTVASRTLTHLITFEENDEINQFIQVSVFLGLVSTFLCMEGIVLLRRLATFAFPLLFLSFLIVFILLPEKAPHANGNPLSLAGLTLVLATNLGISSDYPTFFRHSKSWADSIKALILIQLISIILGILSLYFGSLILKTFEINESLALSSDSYVFYYALILFISLSVITANVANVYSASVGWEVLAPKALVGRKEYLILGLGLTILFILFSNFVSLDYLLTLSETSLVHLCIILILGYLVSKWFGKPTTPVQIVYFIAWLLATASYFVQVTLFPKISAVELGFFVILFVVIFSFGVMRLTGHLSLNMKR